MKEIKYLFYIILFIKLIIQSLSEDEYEYIQEASSVIDLINEEHQMSKEDFESTINYLIDIFNDAYAFNEISINPPQPSFNEQYHQKIDLIVNLLEIKDKVSNDEITQVYDFYSEISYAISQLKDCHIQIDWNFLNLKQYTILSPIEFTISQGEEEDEEPKLYANCLTECLINGEYPTEFDNILNICSENEESPIETINDMNPFDFINNFGLNFLSTKNEHATFSFKLHNHNVLPLSDYPLKINDFENLNIVFSSEATINTKYYIAKNNIDERRNLKANQNEKSRKQKKRNKKRNLHNHIIWYRTMTEKNIDIFKCYEDAVNEINVYYISSFDTSNKDRYIKIIEDCYMLFDKNDYPIIVINDLNEGGLVSLSQYFLGILSPLMPIDLYKGRLRITDSFKETEEIKKYIENYLTSTENCLHTNYEQLINQKVQVNYNENIKMDLTQMFYLNNISTHNSIENARKKMERKRKPTDILIFTDGYTFSAAGLLIQYLQKSGGGIVASYLGNPNRKDKFFDIGQSPSPVFTHDILKKFSEKYNNLLEMNQEDEDENLWEIQMPGIQSFYDIEDYKNPLEYEVIPADIHSNIYVNLDEESYEKFRKKAKKILDHFKTDCNPNNQNLIKISENCDNKFGNKYTHGGYQCGEDGKWKDICVPSYCDPGYLFDKKKKKCVRDKCSSLPIEIEDGGNNNEKKWRRVSMFNIIFGLLLIFSF